MQNLGANASPTVTPPSKRLLPGTPCAKVPQKDSKSGRGIGGHDEDLEVEDCIVASSQKESVSQYDRKSNAFLQSPTTIKSNQPSNSALSRKYSNTNSSTSSSTLSPSSQASTSLDHSSDGVALSHQCSERDSRELDDDDEDDDVILSSQKPSFWTGHPYSRSSSRKEIIFESEEEQEEEGDLFDDSSIDASNCHDGEGNDDDDTVASSQPVRWLEAEREEIDDEDDTVASSQPVRFETEQSDEHESIMSSQLPLSKTPRLRSSRK